jgi:hypothetical protein
MLLLLLLLLWLHRTGSGNLTGPVRMQLHMPIQHILSAKGFIALQAVKWFQICIY